MKIDTTLGAAMQTSIANNEHIPSQKTEISTTPAYQVELTGTVHDTTSKIAAAISNRRSSLGAYNSMDLETAKAMKTSSQTQKPQWEITATEMSMDLLNGRSGDISAGVSMGILKNLYTLTKNFDTDVVARQEKFMQAANNIQSEGAQEFLRYNKMYAGIAKEASEGNNAGTIEKWKKAGQWSADLDQFYQAAKDYADKLQAKSGILIGVDLKYKATEHLSGANSINAAYLGSYAQVGVNLLNFMANHQNAEDIWVKAVQGNYQDADALYSALNEQGHADIATSLQNSIQSARDKIYSGTMKLDKSVAQFSYNTDMGEIWRQSIGETSFSDFTAKFGLKNVKIIYTAKELAAIANDSPENLADLQANPQLRDENGFIVDNQSQPAKHSQTNAVDEQIAALQDKIKRIQKQISALQKNPHLSPEELTHQTQNYQKQIETYQRQISDIKIQQLERQKYS